MKDRKSYKRGEQEETIKDRKKRAIGREIGEKAVKRRTLKIKEGKQKKLKRQKK